MNPFEKVGDAFKLSPYVISHLKNKFFGKKKVGMESKTKNRKSSEQVSKMVERAFPGLTLANGDDALIELKDGWFNAAYNVRLSNSREVILKIAPPKGAEIMTYEKSIMTTEVGSMRMVAANPAIPVPEIYFYDTAHDLNDSDYFFMEKLSGENYNHVKKDLPKEMQTRIDTQIGGIIREINQYTGTYFGYEGNPELRADNWRDAFIKIVDSILEDGRRKNAEYKYSIDEIHNAVVKHSKALEGVIIPHLVHWDAWDPNFFVKDGQISGILDFERALWADPLMEAQFRALAFGGVSDSLRGYGKTEFTHEEDERNHLYTLHLALVMKTEDYYRHYDTDEVSNMAMMMLVPAMMWLKEN
jgi:aminoglycoside phosphotransferase (APT) family kinase protein